MYQIYTVKYAGVDPENGNALYWARRTDGTEEGKQLVARPQRRRSPRICREPSGVRQPPAPSTAAYLPTSRSTDSTSASTADSRQAARWSTTATSCSCTAPTITMPVWPCTRISSTHGLPKTATPTCPHSPGRAIRPTYVNALSDRWLISSNYFTINNITAGYTLPKKVADKLCCSNIRVYFSGDNLYLWSKRKGLDPVRGYAHRSPAHTQLCVQCREV